ncbi:MAG: archease [Methanothrix sp.]
MIRYRFMPHTADVRFLAYGKTIAQMLENSLLAMFDTQADIRSIEKRVKAGQIASKTLEVRESASSERDALWYLLQRVLSELDAISSYGYGVEGIRVKKSKKGFEVSANILYVEQDVEYSRIYVKGVSGYTLEVKKIGDYYRASVVIDI